MNATAVATVQIIGCVSGYDKNDKRCNDCVDFLHTGQILYTGDDFSCTYCGDAYKDGLTSTERYERKHNVKHCDHCLSYAAPFTGTMCADCVEDVKAQSDVDEMLANVAALGVMVDVIEPGMAIIAGMGIIRRENGKYVATADYLMSGQTEQSKGFSTYQAAARWMVRTYGGKGRITVHMHKDGS